MNTNQPNYPIQYPIYNKPNDKMEPLDDNDYGHFYDLDYENYINYYPFSREKYKRKISKNFYKLNSISENNIVEHYKDNKDEYNYLVNIASTSYSLALFGFIFYVVHNLKNL